jgi:hypothetical protein
MGLTTARRRQLVARVQEVQSDELAVGQVVEPEHRAWLGAAGADLPGTQWPTS